MDHLLSQMLHLGIGLLSPIVLLAIGAATVLGMTGRPVPPALIRILLLALGALIGIPFALAAIDAASTAVLIGGLIVLVALVLGLIWRIARLQRRRAGAAHRWIRTLPRQLRER